MYVRRTKDVWKLFVDYGQGYEYELSEESLSEAKQRVREYRENCPQYPTKIKRCREKLAEIGI